MMKDWKTIYSVKGPKTMMEMTAVELMEAMKETKTIILSFGAIENHGAHLPLGADYYQAEALIRCTYEALLEKGHKTVPGFAVPFGTQTNQFERQGEHLVGNAYLFEKVFIDMTESLILSLHETGFEKFILIINHSENQAALHVAAKDLANRYQLQCIVCDWVAPHNDFWPLVLKNAEHQGHGGEDETACVMATVPELVHLEGAKPYYAPEDEHPVKMGGLYYYGGSVGVFTPVAKYLDHSPGYIGDPADATPAEGIVCLEQYAKWIAQVAEKYLFYRRIGDRYVGSK